VESLLALIKRYRFYGKFSCYQKRNLRKFASFFSCLNFNYKKMIEDKKNKSFSFASNDDFSLE
jgi:hypothetical protein